MLLVPDTTLRSLGLGAVIVGVVSVLGAEVGVQIATRIDESVLRRLFGVLVIGVAAQLAVRTVRQGRRYPDGS